MKKSWLVLLLAPCLSFAAYPIHEVEYEDSQSEVVSEEESFAEEFEAAYAQRHALIEEEAVSQEENFQEEPLADESEFLQEDSIAYENELQEEEVAYEGELQEEEIAVVPQRRLQKHSQAVASEQSTRRASDKKAQQAKPSAAKRTSAKKNTSVRSKAQASQQNSNRPRVTHRKQGERRAAERQIEADAQFDTDSYEEVQAPRAKKTTGVSQRKSAYAPRQKQVERRSFKSKKSKAMPAKQRAKAHTGKRPLSEMP